MNPTDLINITLIDLDASLTLRSLLIDDRNIDMMNCSIDDAMTQCPRLRRIDLEQMRDAILALDRESLTQLLLDNSLCPLHCCDYAICFDDDDAECAAIRMIHPDHDT